MKCVLRSVLIVFLMTPHSGWLIIAVWHLLEAFTLAALTLHGPFWL